MARCGRRRGGVSAEEEGQLLGGGDAGRQGDSGQSVPRRGRRRAAVSGEQGARHWRFQGRQGQQVERGPHQHRRRRYHITSHHIEETDAGLDRPLYLRNKVYDKNFKITKLLS